MEALRLLEPESNYDSLRDKHDKGYKFLLSSKKIFVQMLKSFVNEGWVDKIDESNVVRVDKSFITQDFKGKEADLVYRAKLNGKEVIFYLLLEMQSRVDYQMPYRLLLYMVEIWRSILKDDELKGRRGKQFKLPIIIPCVLYNGKAEWNACRSFRDYLSGSELFEDNVLDFKYILIDINRYNQEELIKLSNLIGAVFLVEQKDKAEQFVERIKKLVKTIEKFNEDEMETFKTWISKVVIKGMPKKQQKKVMNAIDRNEESDDMVNNIEVAMREFKIRSIREGKAEGRLEGRAEGRLEGKAEAILELLGDLGTVPQELEIIIKNQRDFDVLTKWHKISAKAESIEAFREKAGI